MSAGPASSQGSGGSTNAAARSAMTSNQAYDLSKTKTKKTFGGEYSKENQNPNNNIQTSKNKNTTYNNNGGGGSDNNNTITQVTKTAPTEAEVSQATTAEVSQSEAANADTEANRLLKIKKKGRSQSIISGSQGVTKTSTDYSLGKKSLLGRV